MVQLKSEGNTGGESWRITCSEISEPTVPTDNSSGLQ